MQAIITKYIPATATRGNRIVAKTGGGVKIVFPYDDSWGLETNHISACRALMNKLQWNNEFVTGSLGNDYVHVML